MPIEVTVRDTETGESQTRTIENDYVVICAGDRYLAGVVAHGNGTAVVTIKRAES